VIGFDRERLEYLISRGATLKRHSIGLRVADGGMMTRKLGLVMVEGAYVGKVDPGSVGERVGLKEGDIITELNSQPVRDVDGLQKLVSKLEPGQLVTVRFLRGGKEYQSSTVI
ncbi:MAG: PDZ domain-containing protein, partial [Dehalococcoidia bacterium]|nr:PDZ domain-containing protein [Dehalococcoidia bacterium]